MHPHEEEVPARWIVPHVHVDVAALRATLEVIAGQSQLGAFFAAKPQLSSAVIAQLADRAPPSP
jgi:hypothetical protein